MDFTNIKGSVPTIKNHRKHIDYFKNSNSEFPLSLRELFEKEQSQQLHQASVEEQLDTVRQSLQDQNSAAQSLLSELKAQMENIQKQVTQVIKTQINQILPGNRTELFCFTTLIHPDSVMSVSCWGLFVLFSSLHSGE